MPSSFFGSNRRVRAIALAVVVALTLLYLAVPRYQAWDSPDSIYPPDALRHDRPSPAKEPPPPLKGNDQNHVDLDDGADAGLGEKPIKPPKRPADEPAVLRPTTTTTSSASSSASTSTTPPIAAAPPPPAVNCMGFESWQHTKPGPASAGKRKFPLVRPPRECRTFHLPVMEELLERMNKTIKDPDLFRLFENTYPNTLDTMIKWRGYAKKEDPLTKEEIETDEELTYVITGDIDAMWLRDSASQIYSYLPLLEASTSPDSLASLWRGLINAHSRYIIISPYCHSFQPPPESGIHPTTNGAYNQNHPMPPYDPKKVFDCKWELDSLASFLQVSSAYYQRTGDLEFFSKYSWVEAVGAAVDAAGAMRKGTYGPDGKVLPSAWTFTGWTNRGSETLTNDGLGNPVRENGMVRTGFRPSDDACIFQLLVPANMMWAKYLEEASHIMAKLTAVPEAANLTTSMREQARGIRAGIERDAVVPHRDFGDIFAYEVDGFGGANLMDDANIPSLLAMPLWNYTQSSLFDLPRGAEPMLEIGGSGGIGGGDPSKKPRDYAAIYQNTRRFVLSDANPYWSKGPGLSAVGGPHLGPGRGWPMAAIMAGLTAYEPLSGLTAEDAEDAVETQLRMVLDSTAGTGVIHESVNAFDDHIWTRAWFGWANGLFGELVLKIAARNDKNGGLLGKSWQ